MPILPYLAHNPRKLNEAWKIALLFCPLSCAAIFNCLDSAGLYYVSYAANINVTSALTACANGGFQHVPQSSTTGSCFQRYYAHLVAAGNANITLWIQGSSGLTCYPQSAPCPTLSSFICGKTDIAAAPG